ncbi:MAG TPA: hypothetical protein VIR58_06740 [Acidimicrobiales bacterium]
MFYLAYAGSSIDPSAEGPWDEILPLADGLAFVRSELHRSAVYHALKDLLPAGTELLVAELHEVPKFKGMAPGALAWARRNISTTGS